MSTTVIFLGTGTSQGIPIIGCDHPVCLSNDLKDKRLRVSIWIKTQKTSVVIDCGPDFRTQMLRSNCQKIDGILFTHEHADHTAGFDDIRPFYFKQGPINIYAEDRVLNNLKKRFDYIFEKNNRYPGAPEVIENKLSENRSFTIGDLTLEPIRCLHGKLPIFGFLFNEIVYLTDIKTIAQDQMDKIKFCKVLILSCIRHEAHPMHFNLKEALEFSRQIKAQTTYLTHISHLLGFHQEIQSKLPENVFLAYDNFSIQT